jgi:hypothetical protein
MEFTHKGKRFELVKDDFVKAIKGAKAGRIQKYSVIISGNEYPIRQVVAAGTGRPVIEFTTSTAYSILQRAGFDIQIDE